MDNYSNPGSVPHYQASSQPSNQKTNVSLYVCDIPQNITKEELDSVFRCFAGFNEVRLARDKNRQRIAFVDYQDERSAQYAMESVKGFRFGNSPKGITVRFSENTKNNQAAPLSGSQSGSSYNKYPPSSGGSGSQSYQSRSGGSGRPGSDPKPYNRD